MESNGVFIYIYVKNEGFLKKSQKSSWISTISKIRHYGSKTDVLGDILSPYPFLDQIWTTFRKMDFSIFFGFSNILCYFPLLFWGPKMSKYDFFKWNLEWPPDVQIMYTKLSQGQFICVLSISKLRMTISHEELAKIDIYVQNTSNDPLCRVSNRPTWLLATYIFF